MPSFCEPWDKCNNCKQPFQGQLGIDLSSACVSFAEATYGHPDGSKWDKMRVMESLRLKISKLGDSDADITMLINQLLDTVKQTKKDLNMSGWIHMPKSSEDYHYYRALCIDYEAYVHHQLVGTFLQDASEEGNKVAIGHLKKARAIYNLFGMKDKSWTAKFQRSMPCCKKQRLMNSRVNVIVSSESMPFVCRKSSYIFLMACNAEFVIASSSFAPCFSAVSTEITVSIRWALSFIPTKLQMARAFL